MVCLKLLIDVYSEVAPEEVTSTEAAKESPVKKSPAKKAAEAPESNGKEENGSGDAPEDTPAENGDAEESNDATENGDATKDGKLQFRISCSIIRSTGKIPMHYMRTHHSILFTLLVTNYQLNSNHLW